ncbi:hypothetical protein R3P38DRAFT_3243811 [Favolaschia claudopus]|uniref:Uncharacterized protein n=1 Tax=Favolaschia claudopus TaxID=2862362 RepID=A0AAV9Z2K6_9AGAR
MLRLSPRRPISSTAPFRASHTLHTPPPPGSPPTSISSSTSPSILIYRLKLHLPTIRLSADNTSSLLLSLPLFATVNSACTPASASTSPPPFRDASATSSDSKECARSSTSSFVVRQRNHIATLPFPWTTNSATRTHRLAVPPPPPTVPNSTLTPDQLPGLNTDCPPCHFRQLS